MQDGCFTGILKIKAKKALKLTIFEKKNEKPGTDTNFIKKFHVKQFYKKGKNK